MGIIFNINLQIIHTHSQRHGAHIVREKDLRTSLANTEGIYLLHSGLKHTATVVLPCGPRWPCLGKHTKTSWPPGLHLFSFSSRAASVLIWRSAPYTTSSQTVNFDFNFYVGNTGLKLYRRSVKISPTTSVPAAVSWSRQTQSHAWGALFFKTTFSTEDVPKYTVPNRRQESGAPCKIPSSLHGCHLEGGSNKDEQTSFPGAVFQLSTLDSMRPTDLPSGQRSQDAAPLCQLWYWE